MPKQSAGLLPFRTKRGFLEVLLVHPGGPFYAKKDLGSWSIAKGEFGDEEEPLVAARREFFEETGMEALGEYVELTPIKQKSGKRVFAWAIEMDINPTEVKSNTFLLEFPPKTGIIKEYPEIDRAEWFGAVLATQKIISYQVDLISELILKLGREEDIAPRDVREIKEIGEQPSLF